MSKLTPIQQVYEILENYTVTEAINMLYQNKDRLLKEDEDRYKKCKEINSLKKIRG